jgi:hypothetical protein
LTLLAVFKASLIWRNYPVEAKASDLLRAGGFLVTAKILYNELYNELYNGTLGLIAP